MEAIGRILDAHANVSFCLSSRLMVTKCTCLHDHLNGTHGERHRERFQRTFVSLGEELLQQREKRDRARDFFVPFRTDPFCDSGDDVRRHQQYSFRFVLRGIEGFGDAGDEEAVFLCHNTVATLFVAVTGISRKEILDRWFRNVERDRNSARIKANAMRILHRLAVSGVPPRPARIDWTSVSGLPEGLSSQEVHRLVDRLGLRSALEEEQFLVIGTPKAKRVVVDVLGGRVSSLPLDSPCMASHLAALKAAGERKRDWKRVDRNSVPHGMEKHRVMYSPFEHKEKAEAHGATMAFWDILGVAVKNMLGRPVHKIDVDASFLCSEGHAPQRAHLDFNDADLSKGQGRTFLGFTPLAPSGCLLQVWRRQGGEGLVLFVPYGKLLLLPADTVHGGGFLLSRFTRDLRLHFYIYIDKAGQVIHRQNVYLDTDTYRDSAAIAEGRPLAQLFAPNVK